MSSEKEFQYIQRLVDRGTAFQKAADAERAAGQVLEAYLKYNTVMGMLADEEIFQTVQALDAGNSTRKRYEAMLETLARSISDTQEGALGARGRGDLSTSAGTGAGGRSGGKDEGLSSAELCIAVTPSISYTDLAGMKREKKEMLTGFVYPSLYPSLFKSVKAILLYGPPGTGKTEIAKASVRALDDALRRGPDDTASHVLMFNADGATLKGMYVGETEKRIKGTFKCAAEAAGNDRLAIIFMDEMDAIGGKRSAGDPNMVNSVNALISSLEGAESTQSFDRVKILGSTNRPWTLDSALLRRFARKVLVDLPSDLSRAQIISDKLQKYFVTDPVRRSAKFGHSNIKDNAARAEAVRRTIQDYYITPEERKRIVAEHATKADQDAAREALVRQRTHPLLYIEPTTKGGLFATKNVEWWINGDPNNPWVLRWADKNNHRTWDKEIVDSEGRDPCTDTADDAVRARPAFTLTDLMFVTVWTGLNAEGYKILGDLSATYKAPNYADATNRYSWLYPIKAQTNYLETNHRIDSPPQPQNFGYSASDVSKMTDQAINLAATSYAQSEREVPLTLCTLPTTEEEAKTGGYKGRLKPTSEAGCGTCSSSGTCNTLCCALLPQAGAACQIPTERQRACITSDNITLRDFVCALTRFPSTINPKEYVEVVEYHLSGNTKVPEEAAAT